MFLQLVAIAYPDETLGPRAIEEVDRCANELLIDPDSAVFVVCERDSSCQLMTSRRPDATAQWSRFWGDFLGVIAGNSKAVWIDEDFVARLREALTPGTSVALAAVPSERSERLLDALSPLGGTALTCDIRIAPGDAGGQSP